MTQVVYREATVRDYQAASRAGSVLLDDGRVLAFASGALDGQVRLLRLGQRVLLRLVSGPDAELVTAVTLTAYGSLLRGG